jgi:hypothetical protein
VLSRFYFIIITNGYSAIQRNQKRYPDPENFRPERWLEVGWPTYQEPLTRYPTIKGMSSFGWGKRQCLGMTLTQDELLVACGTLCWAFNINFKRDPVSGQEMKVSPRKTNWLLIIKADPWKLDFNPRSETRKQDIIRLWQEAQKDTSEQ